MSRIGAVLLVALSLLLVACGQAILTPDEIHQQQDEIIKEVGRVHGFHDVSIYRDEDGTAAKPKISEGKIIEQKVSVRIGRERGLDFTRECHTVVLWRRDRLPDLMDPEGLGTIQTETTYNAEEVARLPLFAHCFIP